MSEDNKFRSVKDLADKIVEEFIISAELDIKLSDDNLNLLHDQLVEKFMDILMEFMNEQ